MFQWEVQPATPGISQRQQSAAQLPPYDEAQRYLGRLGSASAAAHVSSSSSNSTSEVLRSSSIAEQLLARGAPGTDYVQRRMQQLQSELDKELRRIKSAARYASILQDQMIALIVLAAAVSLVAVV